MTRCASAAASVMSQAKCVVLKRPARWDSGGRLYRLASDLDVLVDLALLDDQRRRHGDAIAGLAHHQPKLEGLDEGVVAARAGRILAGLKIDPGSEAEVADVGDARALQ